MLNGASTLICGAFVSVDPVTSMLPVVPDNVHSGALSVARAVGHVLAGVAIAVVDDPAASVPEDVLADWVSVSELHAASVRTNDAAQAMSRAGEDAREEFTVVTLQPDYATCARVGRYPIALFSRPVAIRGIAGLPFESIK